MNQSILHLSSNSERETGSLGPIEYVDIAWENRWLILLVAFAVSCVAASYAFLAKPIYEANILIQIDNGTPSTKNILSDLATPNESKTGAVSEMEILRSRRVISGAVDNAQLYIRLEPKYFPVIGEWVARHNRQLSTPGIFGNGGYVWGAERAEISLFNVPNEFDGTMFAIVATGADSYQLLHKDSGIAVDGMVGALLDVPVSHGKIQLLVSQLSARPGGEFILTHANRLQTVEQLQRRLQIVERGKQSGIIGVSLEGTDPKLTSRAVNEIGREYIRLNEERKADDAEKSLAFLDKQLPGLKQELERSESEYNRMRNMRDTVNLGEEAKSLLQQSTLAQTKLIELGQRKEELLGRFQKEHPAVQGIEQQIQRMKQEQSVLDAKAKKLPSMEQDLVRLTRNVKVNTEVYTAVLSMAQQLRLASANRVGNARLLDLAPVPLQPVKPKRSMIVMVGATIGFVLGLILVYIKKSLVGRIDSPYDLELMLGIPVIATIPQRNTRTSLLGYRTKNVSPLPHDGTSDSVLESLYGFRTALKWAMQNPGKNNIVMITGPTPGVGKSFVSFHLALTLGSVGTRVLLIDGDIRTGHLHHYFGVQRKNGLSDAIVENLSLERITHRNIATNLDFIPTGRLGPNPAEILAHAQFERLLQAASARYDIVLIDTAPLLSVADPLSIASHVGAIFNVVRGGISTKREIAEAAKKLRQAGHILTGTIFNGSKRNIDRYGYGGINGQYRYQEEEESP